MKHYLLVTILFINCFGCKQLPSRQDISKEIAEAEQKFQEMTAEKGIAEAFHFFADEYAVIKRENDTLIKGKKNILAYYSKPGLKNASVTWSPDFIDVSESGDMAYTYGRYIWKIKTDNDSVQEFTGVFHTVWKKQVDGSWKYVWD